MKFIDEYGNIHKTEKELGRGGQGVVYLTKDKDVVIKEALKNNNIITDKTEIQKFHHLINNIIFKPIPSDIEIARPVALLKDKAGYIMKMLDGMNPIKELFSQELSKEEVDKLKAEIPKFLGEFSKTNLRGAIFITHYLKTGSLRKRLYILAKIATILYRLHLRGLVYLDISPNNIFYSDKIYFIDIDNLKYNSKITQYDAIFTPDYEVPEVASNKESNSFYSDIYAFGILSFYLLTMQHPFKGEAFLNSEDDWESEEVKNIWELPWIEDLNDDSNRIAGGLRGSLTISDELNLLFHKLFEEGKIDKLQRPSLNLWIKSLVKSYIKTIKCPNCNMTYYDDKFIECPYCKYKKPPRIVLKSYLIKDNNKLDVNSYYYAKELSDNHTFFNFLFKEFNIDFTETFLEIIFKKERVEFHFNKNDEEI